MDQLDLFPNELTRDYFLYPSLFTLEINEFLSRERLNPNSYLSYLPKEILEKEIKNKRQKLPRLAFSGGTSLKNLIFTRVLKKYERILYKNPIGYIIKGLIEKMHIKQEFKKCAILIGMKNMVHSRRSGFPTVNGHINFDDGIEYCYIASLSNNLIKIEIANNLHCYFLHSVITYPLYQ